MKGFRRLLFALCTVSLCGCLNASIALAQEDTTDAQQDASMKSAVDALNSQIDQKQARVKELDSLVDKYQDRIKQQEAQQTSLENELLILDNRATKKKLDIERTKLQLESLALELRILDDRIGQHADRVKRQQGYAADLIRDINQGDSVSTFQVLLSQRSLSAFFDRLEEKKRLERDLVDAMDKVKAQKADMEDAKRQKDAKRAELEKQQKALKNEQLALDAEKNFKTSLVAETKMKQSEFERVMYELQQQQQSTSQDISDLEARLKDKLDTVDAALSRGDVLLNWPVDPSRGITAKFHDPTYPFRKLFEHPGVDVRASVGTPITSAAGGYVAWNKRGRLYGNYVMVVHPGNVATVYAHLSKFIAPPDTYVQRGDVLGLTGGMPGQPGAGLSTGPHLHFEVRQDGVPVDPENFLPSISTDDN